MPANARNNVDSIIIAALASGATVKKAAERAGVSEATVYRRKLDESFAAKVRDMQASMIAQSMGKLADSMTAAAAALRKLLRADTDSVRISAARAILEFGIKVRDSVELEARVAALEGKEKTT